MYNKSCLDSSHTLTNMSHRYVFLRFVEILTRYEIFDYVFLEDILCGNSFSMHRKTYSFFILVNIDLF